MNLNIINNSSYDKLIVTVNGNRLILTKDESTSFYVAGDTADFEVLVLEKSKVFLNWFFAAIDGYIDDESVINDLVCNASFTVKEINSDVTVKLKSVDKRSDKNGYIYNSVYAESDGGFVGSLRYSLTDTQKARKKSLFYYIFVCSWFPLLLIALILLAAEVYFLSAVLAILGFAIAIPSWKKASKVKTFYKSETADRLLNEAVAEIIANGGKPKETVPESKFSKFIYRILDTIFGEKSDKQE